VINAPTAPADTCHTFTFTLPRHDTLSAIARTRLGQKIPAGATAAQVAFNAGYMSSQLHLDTRGYHGSAKPEDTMNSSATARAIRESSEIQYYGVTVLTWYHADEKRHEALKRIRNEAIADDRSTRAASMRSYRTADQAYGLMADTYEKPKHRRLKMPWITRDESTEPAHFDTPSDADGLTDRELDSMSPLIRLGIKIRKGPPKLKQYVQLQQEDYAPKVLDGGNVFWIPVAHTLGKLIRPREFRTSS
jgi:nicotinamide N-methyltransferase